MPKKKQPKKNRIKKAESSPDNSEEFKELIDTAKNNENITPMFNYIKEYLGADDKVFSNNESISVVAERMNASGTWQSVKDGNLWKDIIEDKFKKKHKESIESAIKKAKQGDKQALINLIRFDMEILFEDWVQGIILGAWIFGDNEFIKNIGKSISASRGPFGGVRNPNIKFILIGISLGLVPAEKMKDFFESLYDDGEISSADYDYFLKMQRRYKVRKINSKKNK